MPRKKNAINSKLAIAIIGEGLTEREYFKSLKKHSHLSFRFKPDIPKHSDIQSIVNKANVLRESFDIVFCIIDLDRILLNPVEKKRYYELKSKNKHLVFIENNPCFEIWFLLHFEFSAREYSSCEGLVKVLRNYIHDYSKSIKYLENKDIFFFFKDKLDRAIENAIQLDKLNVFTKCEVYQVINQLRKQTQ